MTATGVSITMNHRNLLSLFLLACVCLMLATVDASACGRKRRPAAASSCCQPPAPAPEAAPSASYHPVQYVPAAAAPASYLPAAAPASSSCPGGACPQQPTSLLRGRR